MPMTISDHTQHEAFEHSRHDAAYGDHGDGGHDKHAGHDPEMFRRLFWWNLVLAVPVLVFSERVQDWFGYSIEGAWATWITPVIGTVTVPPAAAALAMSASTMIVAANAQLLRRLDLRPEPLPDSEPAPTLVESIESAIA